MSDTTTDLAKRIEALKQLTKKTEEKIEKELRWWSVSYITKKYGLKKSMLKNCMIANGLLAPNGEISDEDRKNLIFKIDYLNYAVLKVSNAGLKLIEDEIGDELREFAIRKNKEIEIKIKARVAVANALKKGRLIKPNQCEKCRKSTSKLQGHHMNYKKELKVNWFCKKCHDEEHKNLYRYSETEYRKIGVVK